MDDQPQSGHAPQSVLLQHQIFELLVEQVKDYAIFLVDLQGRARAIRERHGWTQQRLAKQAGLSLGFVGRIEIGYHHPRMRRLVRLAAALKVKP